MKSILIAIGLSLAALWASPSTVEAGWPYAICPSYSAGYSQRNYATTNITIPPTNWTTELAKAVQLRDDKAAFLKALDQLGYSYSAAGGYQPTNGYGVNGNYSQLPTGQGNSAYGYNEVSQLYSNTDLGALYAAAARLASDAQGYGDNARQGHRDLVEQAGQFNSRLMEIQSNADAAAKIAIAAGQAAKPQQSLTITKNYVGTQPAQQIPQPPQPGNGVGGVNGNLAALPLPASIQKCNACHAKNQVLQIGFNLTPDQRLDAIGRLMLPEGHEKHMPKNEAIAPEEIAEAISFLSGIKQP